MSQAFKCNIIALCGSSGSGKDTAYNLFFKQKNYLRLAFADELKRMVSKDTYIPISYFEDVNLKDKVMLKLTPRQILQQYAQTKFKPLIDKEYFTYFVCKQIIQSKQNVIITDLRYYDELKVLKRLFPDIKIVWICRNESTQKDNIQITSGDCDYIIENNGDIDEYLHNLIRLFG